MRPTTKVLKSFAIAGIHFRPKEVKQHMLSFNSETTIYLVREPENKFDRFAVKVMATSSDASEDLFCGYIPAMYSQVFSTLLENNIPLRASFVSVNPDAPKGIEVIIAVSLV